MREIFSFEDWEKMPASIDVADLSARMLGRRTVIAAALIAPTLARASTARLVHRDDFRDGLANWVVECERPGRIAAADGRLDIDVPAGVTLWFRHRLHGPLAIDYVVTPVAEGGPNDRVSDVNCFWMAQDPQAPGGNALYKPRTGAFADYDMLRTYYAGIGGNGNSTTRFRRYVGEQGTRPLLPQHDLRAPETLLQANRPLHLRLIANGSHIALLRNGRLCFLLEDQDPYRQGHFGLRTTQSHLRVERLRIWQLGR
ncbi:DUF6250 domain-containing protein [Sphingomonas elodea]|uniref:DUF6250 domain-containing protein n=1 Tax=Sphingomonas elodea TaxID=179878 RepID=UPI000263087D|nr:DUF6250 domain-containing protein [Sphingomonas elodea]